MNNKKTITELARTLRNNPTESEKLLWKHLRRRQLKGYRFLRQKPLIYNDQQRKRYFYIADFYCTKARLVVELDGKIHEYQQEYDYNRDLVLARMNLRTLRIKNQELRNIEEVKNKILRYLEN